MKEILSDNKGVEQVAVKLNSEIDPTKTTDADLVELAGLHVYLEPKRDSIIPPIRGSKTPHLKT
ncbi:hypothetical protein MM221_06165 [Salipaludibacillus sp. LMS25]|jgi:hypothetical protein|uniref:hypothetical protein n=1 Tax=Salipaludibacillus sp. LMS25 TaxID=2924031 RepID=UPI0020D07F7A|nr:hypothetical protein [Salipaludibacillus sp. LMS25]UTR16141.1 hypothetical protein MM221_06165 [Salipaludibacillus sp. LMS25]